MVFSDPGNPPILKPLDEVMPRTMKEAFETSSKLGQRIFKNSGVYLGVSENRGIPKMDGL